MIDRRDPGIALRLELGQAEPHRFWPDLVDVFAECRPDRCRILIGNEPAADLGRRPRRDDRLRPGPLIAAPEAIDLERRTRPVALGRREAGFASQRLEPIGFLQRGFVEGNPRELALLLIAQWPDAVVEPRHQEWSGT